MKDESDLVVLTRFLSHFDPEVKGRATEPPPPDIASRLDRLAAGEADGPERASLAAMLKEHPEWVRHLGLAIRNRIHP